MKAYFMYDCHLFAPVPINSTWQMCLRAWKLFREDSCGTLFVRDNRDRGIEVLTLNSHYDSATGEYVVLWGEIKEWVRKVREAAAHERPIESCPHCGRDLHVGKKGDAT